MKRLSAFAFIFLLTLIASAQSPPPNPGVLELRLQPEEILNGMPTAFTILLENRTSQDVSLPLPAKDCGDVPHGTIRLRLNFVPLKGDSPSEEVRGCVSDYFYQPILERVKNWKLLRSGESISLGLINDRIIAGTAGRYDYWAEYDPPGMPVADEEVLQKAGINFPKAHLESSHVRFVKRR